MKRMLSKRTVGLLLAVAFILNIQNSVAQSGASAVLDTAKLEAQLEYIYDNTGIYNDYRAIREDIFIKLKGNVNDTVSAARLEIESLSSSLSEKEFQIESLNTDLARTRNEKEEAIRNRDSLSFLGIQMNKTLYNSIVWIIILGLASLAAIMFLLFRRSNLVTNEVKQELESTQNEFDDYRKGAREKYEKLVVSHHNEIMKLKGS